jgi:hypothetical protein
VEWVPHQASLKSADDHFGERQYGRISSITSPARTAGFGSEVKMACKACKSSDLQKLDGELTITHPDIKGLKVDPVYVCRSILVCLDCGFTEIVIPTEELHLLKKKKSAIGS